MVLACVFVRIRCTFVVLHACSLHLVVHLGWSLVPRTIAVRTSCRSHPPLVFGHSSPPPLVFGEVKISNQRNIEHFPFFLFGSVVQTQLRSPTVRSKCDNTSSEVLSHSDVTDLK